MYLVIVGCSGAGYHLTKVLLAAGHEVTVVERDHARCQLLWDELGSVVMEGDGTDERILKSAGTARADVFVGAANLDETNLVACQIAKHVFQVPHTMAVVKDTKNEPLFEVLGINVVVNATHLVVNALEEGVPGRPLLHLMTPDAPGLELVSVSIPEDSTVVGKKLNEVVLPPHSFISLVIKKDRAVMPSNDLVLEAQDDVVAVTMTDEEQTLYEILTEAL
ncbi:MAG: TrkA family potassium uptake protein [Chloroflexi bacterium]|nr:TrkA family potassium uptake protein [Chloroflexota bacterium]